MAQGLDKREVTNKNLIQNLVPNLINNKEVNRKKTKIFETKLFNFIDQI